MDSEKDPKTALHIDSADQQLAHVANQEERDSTKWQAIKNNPWSFFWCLFGIWTILLVSFENQAAGIVVGIPQFRKDFGTYYEGNYVLSAEWQAAFQGAPGASCVYPPLFQILRLLLPPHIELTKLTHHGFEIGNSSEP